MAPDVAADPELLARHRRLAALYEHAARARDRCGPGADRDRLSRAAGHLYYALLGLERELEAERRLGEPWT